MYHNIHFIDVEVMLAESSYLAADGIHPSIVGQVLTGDYIGDIMKTYLYQRVNVF